VKVPVLADLSNSSVLHVLLGIAPKALSFAISFFTVAFFWVTHHKLTTAFIGDYLTQPLVVNMIYDNAQK
jgi:uncharacterized membrane protein